MGWGLHPCAHAAQRPPRELPDSIQGAASVHRQKGQHIQGLRGASASTSLPVHLASSCVAAWRCSASLRVKERWPSRALSPYGPAHALLRRRKRSRVIQCPAHALSRRTAVLPMLFRAAGSGLGSFNDRLRDGAMGGGPFAPPDFQASRAPGFCPLHTAPSCARGRAMAATAELHACSYLHVLPAAVAVRECPGFACRQACREGCRRLIGLRHINDPKP